MKNLKNIVAALTLTATLGLGATVANAGVLIADKAPASSNPCASNSGKEILLAGISFIGKAGMLISDGLIITYG